MLRQAKDHEKEEEEEEGGKEERGAKEGNKCGLRDHITQSFLTADED